MVSFILPGNSATGDYDVDNSLRFDSASSDRLNRTLGTPTNNYKWTYSFWTKRGILGSEDAITGAFSDSQNKSIILFRTDDRFEIMDLQSDSYVMQKKTNRRFRDSSAWYHFVISSDATLNSPETKIYVNGVEETSFATTNEYTQNQANLWNSAIANHIGASDSSSRFWDGYLAEFVFIDGQVLDPTSFGKFDTDSPNIWKPIDVSGLTFGNNGFYLDFKDSGTLGNDANGGTDWTASNLTAESQTTDTCTNNFAVINPLDNYFASATLSEGNTKVVTNSSAEAMNTSTFAMTKGKWYFEVDNISGAGAQICGITPTPSFQTSSHGKSGDVTPHTISYVQSGKVQEGDGSGGQTELASYASYSNGNIIGVYMDLDNMKAYFSKDGSLQSSTGIDLEPLASNGTGHYMFFVGDNNAGSRTCEANFGNGFQSLSSAVADDNGHGAFEFSPNITGDGEAKKFFACCSKNLAEFG